MFVHTKAGRSTLLVALAFAVTNALTFQPTPTWAGFRDSALDLLPTITAGVSREALKARQVGDQNAICGWIDGNGASAVSCGASFYCATEQSFVGCCATSSCVGVVTSCYDVLGSTCDASCQQDIGNLVCPSSLPYCATYNYGGGSVGFGCALAQGYTKSVLLSITTSDGGSLTIPTGSSTASSSSSSSTSSTTTPTPVSSSKNGLSGGAIAGIVIGSVVAVALIAFLVFWILRSRRQHSQPTISSVQSPPPMQQDPYQWQEQNSQQYSGAAGAFYPNQKTGESVPGSPPLNSPPLSQVSPYTSEFGQSPRNNQPIGAIAELGDSGERRDGN